MYLFIVYTFLIFLQFIHIKFTDKNDILVPIFMFVI
jgi:hypothetical protein